MSGNYIVLIPAYKPSSDLLNLFKSISDLGFRIVVVNDGSGLDYEKLFLVATAMPNGGI